MKKIILIVLLFCSIIHTAQSPVKTNLTKTSKVQNTKGKYQSARTQNLVSSLSHDTCLNKKFSIVIYILMDTLLPSQPGYPGIGIANPANISLLMQEVNAAFAPICVSFEHCKTVYVQQFCGTNWKKSITEPLVTSSYYTDKTINLYLIPNDSLDLGYTNTEKEGYTYAPTLTNLNTPRKDLIVMEQQMILQANGAILMHLLGHFFGLTHTFEEYTSTTIPPATSLELVDGSNCTTNGDGFCDTEADPGSQSIVTDANGQLYIHPIDNYMSYYTWRCRYSQQQYNKMAYTIATKRLYLH